MLRLTDRMIPITIDAIEGPETASKRRLIAAGERLMGLNGIETTPLHEIAAEAGQANRYAVQYHFGDRRGLTDAIFEIRRRAMSMRRRALLNTALANGMSENIGALLEVVFIPTGEQVDERGEHSYARFLLQFLSRIDFDPQSDDPFTTSTDLKRLAIAHIASILRLPEPLIAWRYYQQNFAMLAALGSRDNRNFRSHRPMSLETVVSETIMMISQAMQAPVADREAVFAALSPEQSTAS